MNIRYVLTMAYVVVVGGTIICGVVFIAINAFRVTQTQYPATVLDRSVVSRVGDDVKFVAVDLADGDAIR